MCAIRQINEKPIIDLLQRSSPGKSKVLADLMKNLHPKFQIDSEELRILFCADTITNTITVGVPCTRRLQAHAYAYAIILMALGTPGYITLSSDERKRLYSLADPLLNWAVSRDLQQWMEQIEGIEPSLKSIFSGAGVDLPNGFLSSLTSDQRIMGEGLFRLALAFILLHELAHLHYGHRRDDDNFWNMEQEKAADQFAAEWLMDLIRENPIKRIRNLFGIAIALLWITVFDVFFWPRQKYQSGYDRLYNVLDQVIDSSNDDEELLIWDFISRILMPLEFKSKQNQSMNYLNVGQII
jgi:Peptidase U49